MTAEYDPITLQIIQSALQAAADEMFAALRKTAMSAIIYEVLDAGTAVTDAAGNLASSGAGVPGFVGILDKSVKRLLELHNKPGDIEPGDVFITNDPYYGGVTHLNDHVLLMPVFHDGRLLAWTANIAHWNDIGGMAPGSISMSATEIFQEGLRLPAVKLISRGEPIRSVIDIMTVNSRLPTFLLGDLWAGVAAVRVGAKRIEEVWRAFYRGAPFVRIVAGEPLPNTAFVRGTNACMMAAVDHPRSGRVVILSVIDNLVKGASGQAVQNLNRMMGWGEETGLKAAALFP